MSSQKLNYNRFHNALETFQDFLKANTNKVSEKGINLLVVNKVCIPTEWQRIDLQNISQLEIPLLKPWTERLKSVLEN